MLHVCLRTCLQVKHCLKTRLSCSISYWRRYRTAENSSHLWSLNKDTDWFFGEKWFGWQLICSYERGWFYGGRDGRGSYWDSESPRGMGRGVGGGEEVQGRGSAVESLPNYWLQRPLESSLERCVNVGFKLKCFWWHLRERWFNRRLWRERLNKVYTCVCKW